MNGLPDLIYLDANPTSDSSQLREDEREDEEVKEILAIESNLEGSQTQRERMSGISFFVPVF